MNLRVTSECRGCGACLLTCPEHAIRPGAARPLVVLWAIGVPNAVSA